MSGECLWTHRDGRWGFWFFLIALWSLFGALLVTLGLTWDVLALRVLGYGVGGMALAVLAGHALFTLSGTEASVAWLPLFNLRALAFAVSVLAIAWVTGMLTRYRWRSTTSEISLIGGIRECLKIPIMGWQPEAEPGV